MDFWNLSFEIQNQLSNLLVIIQSFSHLVFHLLSYYLTKQSDNRNERVDSGFFPAAFSSLHILKWDEYIVWILRSHLILLTHLDESFNREYKNSRVRRGDE